MTGMTPKHNHQPDNPTRPITREQFTDAAKRLLLGKPVEGGVSEDYEPTEAELNEVVRVRTADEA